MVPPPPPTRPGQRVVASRRRSVAAALAVLVLVAVVASVFAVAAGREGVTAGVEGSAGTVRDVVPGDVAPDVPVTSAVVLSDGSTGRDGCQSTEELLAGEVGTNVSVCTVAALQVEAQVAGTAAALELLQRITTATGLYSCHNEAHAFGRFIGMRDGLAGIAADDKLCDRGYIHGVLQGVFMEADEASFDGLIASACTDSTDPGECAHATGHAITSRIPDDVAAAVAKCAQVPVMAELCPGGVLMEYGDKVLDPHQGSYDPLWLETPGVSITAQEVRDVCASAPDGLAEGCWDNVGKLWSHFYGKDWAAMLAGCAELAGTPGHAGACASGTGKTITFEVPVAADMGVADARTWAEWMRDACRSGPVELAAPCVGGAMVMRATTENWAGVTNPTPLCDVVTGPERDACLAAKDITDTALAARTGAGS